MSFVGTVGGHTSYDTNKIVYPSGSTAVQTTRTYEPHPVPFPVPWPEDSDPVATVSRPSAGCGPPCGCGTGATGSTPVVGPSSALGAAPAVPPQSTSFADLLLQDKDRYFPWILIALAVLYVATRKGKGR